MSLKYCKGCKRKRRSTSFSKNKSNKDGLCFYCKDCEKERLRITYKVTKKNDKEVIWNEMVKLRNKYEKLQRRLKSEQV